MTGTVVVCAERGRVVLDTFAVPEPRAGEVLLATDYSVISAGTERANLIALPNTETADKGFPWYPGYAAAGRVLAVGAGVTHLQPGDRAVVAWGGHRSHTIKPATAVVRIADERVPQLDAAFAHIASFAFLGVRKLHLELGEATMIAGQGILGVLALQLACLSGAIPVVVADLDPARRALAMSLGATAALAPDAPDFVARVKEACGGDGPRAVVEVTGAALALQQALEYIAWEGRIALLGCTRIADVPIDFYRYVHRRGVTLIGAHTFTRARQESAPGRWTEHDDYRTFLQLVAARRLHVRPLVSEIVSPAAAPEVYARLAETANPPLGIVFDWQGFAS